jgi:hypothetical protein
MMIRTIDRSAPRALAAAALAFTLAACSGDGTGGVQPDPGYRTAQPAMAVGLNGATASAILSVGDTVPGGFVYAPVPDGLGGYAEGDKLVLFNSHELGVNGVPAAAGGTLFGGARVSRLVLDRQSMTVLGGSYAVDAAAGYRNLCSATYADASMGLPSGWFLAGEEQTGAGKDGIQLAVGKAGQVVEMPWIGRFGHENLVPVPGFAGRVVLAGLDDTRGRSELYLYIGRDETDVITGQGLLYVFASAQAANVGQLTAGQAIDGHFVAIPNAAAMSSAQLQAAADAAGALKFAGIEDGDYDRRAGLTSPALYFVDTGSPAVPATGAQWDPYGSIYRMEFQALDPTRARLTLLARSQGPASGWASPDNVGTSPRSVMVQEDPSHPDWARAARIWRFPLFSATNLGAALPVAELQNADCRYDTGCWESSGIVDASSWFGEGIWLFDVQAHTRPEPRLGITRESGQLLSLRVPGS